MKYVTKFWFFCKISVLYFFVPTVGLGLHIEDTNGRVHTAMTAFALAGAGTVITLLWLLPLVLTSTSHATVVDFALHLPFILNVIITVIFYLIAVLHVLLQTVNWAEEQRPAQT